MVQLALCDGDRDRCVSPAALQFLAIVDTARAREGRARLGEINRAINLAIRPDERSGSVGRDRRVEFAACHLRPWRGRFAKDYAIAKFVALREAGVSSEDLRIVNHARTPSTARTMPSPPRAWTASGWTLDNRRMAMVEDVYVRNYRPTFVIDPRTGSNATRKRRCPRSNTASLFRRPPTHPRSRHRRCRELIISFHRGA